jgi:hypothetical protein
MPVEIRELVIKTTIVEDNSSAAKTSVPKDNKEDFIAECVEEVIRILNEEKER